MQLIELNPSHAAEYQRLRLGGLKQCPSAFASSFEEEVGFELAVLEKRLEATSDKAVFGAFRDTRLVGMCGVMREHKIKLRHKAWIWGVYVEPELRGG